MTADKKSFFDPKNYPIEIVNLLAQAFDQMDNLGGLMDLEGNILFANQAGLNSVGYNRLDQVFGMPFSKSPWRNHSQKAMDMTEEMIANARNGIYPVVEDYFIGPTGKPVNVLFSITPLRDTSGNIIALIPEGKIIEDIKKLQEEIENEQWETQQWINSMGSFIAKCNPDGRIIKCNKTFLDALKVSQDYICGRHLCDMLNIQHLRNSQRKIQRALIAAQAGNSQSLELRFAFRKEKERTFLFNVSPIMDSNRNICFFAVEITDITEQVGYRELTLQKEKAHSKLLEQEVEIIRQRLEKTEQFNKHIVDSVPIGVLYLDRGGRVTLSNPKMTQYFEEAGISEDEISGKKLTELNLFLADHSWRKLPDSGDDQVTYGQKRMLLYKNTNNINSLYFEVLSGPLKIPYEGIKGTVLTFNDVTEWVFLENELLNTRIQAEKMNSLGLLISGVAHEINNPLTSIVGCAEYLVKDSELTGDTEESAKIIHDEAQRASVIVKNLLSLVYPHKKGDVRLNLNDIIRHIGALRQNELSKRNIELHLNLSDKLEHLVGDATHMQQIIINFVQNSADAIEESGIGNRITIRTMMTGNWISLEVSDNGPNIPEEHHSKIFDPFFTTKPPGKGTGLGLSITYRIVQRYGGKILLRSSQEGGACFIVHLPVNQQALESKDEDDDGKNIWVPDKILIVDDEKNLRFSLSKYLISLGASVDTAENGRVAQQKINQHEYDILLVDVKMPVMGGVELYQQLCEERSPMVDRFAFMSGLSALEIRYSAIAPEVPLLRKPFSRKEILHFFSLIKPKFIDDNRLEA